MSAPVATSASSAQAAQTGLVIAAAPLVDVALQQLDIGKLSTSIPQLKALLASVVNRYAPVSAALSARFYSSQRTAAGLTSRFRAVPADSPPLEQVGAAVDWATQPLWSAQPDMETTRVNLTGSVEKLILDTGRDTILQNVHRDPEARGWARIPEPTACYFCALLATRGDVYKNQKTAGFKSHDHCRCHAEPIFTAYEPSAQIRRWRADYAAATRNARGMKNKQLAWRRAFENRTTS